MKYSILNLVPIKKENGEKDAYLEMVDLAQAAEKWGYVRYWIAEHHNTKLFASSATQLLIEKTLANTKTIQVGSGGVMLPNHTPYIVAEQYGMLEKMYPGRVNLGLGRTPGTDAKTAMAIRKENFSHQEDFEADIEELISYFEDTNDVHAYPAAGVNVPIYILGSSTFSAHLAARLGLPYAFASHFAPAQLVDADQIYYREFKPSRFLDKPYMIVGINAYVADTDKEAKYRATIFKQTALNIITGQDMPTLPKPVKSEDEIWNNYLKAQYVPHFGPVALKNENIIGNEKDAVQRMTDLTVIGNKKEAKEQIEYLRSKIKFDELMVNSYIYDEVAWLNSYRLFSEVVKEIN